MARPAWPSHNPRRDKSWIFAILFLSVWRETIGHDLCHGLQGQQPQYIQCRQRIAFGIEERVCVWPVPGTSRVGDISFLGAPVVDADAAAFRRFFDRFD